MKYRYLMGGSGIPNFGDELIADQWVRKINQLHPEDSICLDVKNVRASMRALSSGTEATHVSHIRKFIDRRDLVGLSYLKHTIGKALRMYKPDVGNVWHYARAGRAHFEHQSTKLNHLELLLPNLKSFHVFGGGYINARWAHSAYLLGLGVALRHRAGADVFATGLGLVPWTAPATDADHEIANEIGTAFEIIELRDRFSVSASGIEKAVLGLDDAFLASPPVVIPGGPATLHLSITFTRKNYDRYSVLLDRIKDELSSSFERIIFWNNAPQKDLFARRAISKRFPQTIVFDAHKIAKGLIPFGSRDFMVTTRFHPHLMAARAGISGYYIHSSRYYQAKHRSLVELGSGFKRLDLDHPDLEVSYDSGVLHIQDTRLVERKHVLANKLYAK